MPPAHPVLSFEGFTDDQPGTPGIETFQQSTIDKCIESLVEVIIEALKSKSPNKFTEVQRLCGIGHQLIRTKAISVDDFVKAGGRLEQYGQGNYGVRAAGYGGNNVAYYDVNPVGPQIVGAGMIQGIQGRDDFVNAGGRHKKLEDLNVEKLVSLLGDMTQTTNADKEASELESLLALKEKLPEEKRVSVQTRIDALLKNLETRNTANAQRDEAKRIDYDIDLPSTKVAILAQVVPADVHGGHPLGEEERRDDARAGVRDDAQRREGAPNSPEARHAEAPPGGYPVG